MGETIKVANIWTDFYPHLFSSPHEYLLSKEGWDSQTFAARLVSNQGSDIKKAFYFSEVKFDNLFKGNIIDKALYKLREKKYWNSYNNWCLSHSEFKDTKVVHAHFGYTGVRLLPLLRKTNLPLVVSFYGVDGSKFLKERKWRREYLKMFEYSKKTIVLCQEVKDRLMDLGLQEEKIKMWRIPIELESYPYSPRHLREEVKFIIAARFVAKKGYPYLLEAFARLINEGRNVKLTIIGYGEESRKIENFIKQNKLEKHINLIDTRLIGSFSQVYNNLLKEHDIFVLPSVTAKNGDDEGGPALTLVAAQAAGLPVICTAFPGAEMSVVDQYTGLICEPASSDSLYSKMLYLLEHREKWNDLGKAASDFVNEKFAYKTQMEEIVDVYKEVLQNN